MTVSVLNRSRNRKKSWKSRHTRVELVEAQAKFSEAGKELRLDAAVNGVVHALVGGRLDPVIRTAECHNFGHLPSACHPHN
jgi:hypothetical protein